MNIHKTFMSVVIFLMTAIQALAYSPAETNTVVSELLLRAQYLSSLPHQDGEVINPTNELNTLEKFLWPSWTNGWTMLERQHAFDCYLSIMSTNDCRSLNDESKIELDLAVGQCLQMNYTNSVLPMCLLAMNPRGICREEAMEIVFRFGMIDATMINMTQMIVSNRTDYSALERAETIRLASERLLEQNDTGTYETQFLTTLYNLRKEDTVAAMTLDHLFCSKISNYLISSNRLDVALFMVSATNVTDQVKSYFTAITNQLLSSGQPLQQLTVEGAGE